MDKIPTITVLVLNFFWQIKRLSRLYYVSNMLSESQYEHCVGCSASSRSFAEYAMINISSLLFQYIRAGHSSR